MNNLKRLKQPLPTILSIVYFICKNGNHLFNDNVDFKTHSTKFPLTHFTIFKPFTSDHQTLFIPTTTRTKKSSSSIKQIPRSISTSAQPIARVSPLIRPPPLTLSQERGFPLAEISSSSLSLSPRNPVCEFWRACDRISRGRLTAGFRNVHTHTHTHDSAKAVRDEFAPLSFHLAIRGLIRVLFLQWCMANLILPVLYMCYVCKDSGNFYFGDYFFGGRRERETIRYEARDINRRRWGSWLAVEVCAINLLMTVDIVRGMLRCCLCCSYGVACDCYARNEF